PLCLAARHPRRDQGDYRGGREVIERIFRPSLARDNAELTAGLIAPLQKRLVPELGSRKRIIFLNYLTGVSRECDVGRWHFGRTNYPQKIALNQWIARTQKFPSFIMICPDISD